MSRIIAFLVPAAFYLILHVVVLYSDAFDARPGTLLLDEQDYLASARLLAETGHYAAWGGQPAFRTPLYTIFLGLLKVMFGGFIHHIQLAQILLGFFSGLLLWRIARRFMGEAAALATLALFWFYPNLVIYRYLIYSETLYLFLFLATLFFLLRPGSLPAKSHALWGGLLFGLLILTRAEYLLAGLAIAFWLYKKRQKQAAVLFLIAVALAVMPWLIRNSLRYGTPVFTTMTGYNLWMGNNPKATGSGVVDDNPQSELMRVLNEVNQIPPTSDNQRSVKFREHALRYIGEHPGDALVTGFYKLGFLWAGETRILEWAAYRGRIGLSHHAYAALHAALLSLWPLMLVLAALLWLFRAVPNLGFLYWLPVISSATIFVFSGEDRYHLAFTPVLFLLLSGGIEQLCRNRGSWRQAPTPWRSAVAVLMVAFVLWASLRTRVFYNSMRDSFDIQRKKSP